MRRTGKVALVIEVAVCFSAAALCLFVLWLPGFFINLGDENQNTWQRLEPAVFVLSAIAGLSAAFTLLYFILFGVRSLPPWLLLPCSLAGLILSGWATAGFIAFDSLQSLAIIPAGPLLCGLHLLYLGRSYFAPANKPMEPTR